MDSARREHRAGDMPEMQKSFLGSTAQEHDGLRSLHRKNRGGLEEGQWAAYMDGNPNCGGATATIPEQPMGSSDGKGRGPT